ncbi:MAG: cation:proton antiporter [Anaerolineae bacterium]|nr:cation:proton antiporter [Anaerolineae bacterium]
MENVLVQLAAVAIFGIGAQWLAWRLRLPSILLLLLFGFLLGPVLGIIHPDELLGEALFPIVSLAVGVILFEGGLTLKLKELPVSGPVIGRLITVGAVATWIVATLAARFVIGLQWPMAILVGAVLIVTGPTVVGPLLRQIRPKGRAGAILKWEGILIDPVGAVLAVLVFESIRLGEVGNVPVFILLGVLRSLAIGLFFGFLGAGTLIALLRRYLVPDHLQNSVTLLLMFMMFALSDLLAPEGGLLAVTVMGVVMANQPWVPIRHIVEFKENLQILLVGLLFILLAGRINISDLLLIGWGAVIFVVILIVIARPLSVLLSTWGSPLNRSERLFLMWMAPRGIVAASVASVFAFQLSAAGLEGAELLVPIVFLVIVITVIFYGLTAGPVARRLGLAEHEPQGVLFVGASLFSRELAEQLEKHGIRALLLDSNYRSVAESRLAGLQAHHGNALLEDTLEGVDLGGIGRMVAMTSNDEVNTLAVLRYPEIFGRSEVYQLPSAGGESYKTPSHLRGRILFGTQTTYDFLEEQIAGGASVKGTPLTNSFTYEEYLAENQGAIPLGLIMQGNRLTLFTADIQPHPRPGQTILSLAPANSSESQD